jgi:hypothetical protein
MARRRSTIRTSVLAAAVAAAALAMPSALADGHDGAPLWEQRSDGGQLSADVAQHVASSLGTNSNGDTAFVVGSTAKPQLLQTLGINDLDVLTAAYDTATGEELWTKRFDNGGHVDRAAGVEVNDNNNILYVPINSGTDIVNVAYAIRDGNEVNRTTYPGARAEGSAISSAGGFMATVGSAGGRFLVLSHQTGLWQLEMEDRPVRGEAFDADMIGWEGAGTGYGNTVVVTGRSTEADFGDMYTVAYDYRRHVKLWERTWPGPAGGRDEGLVTELARVGGLGGQGVAFVAGRSHSSATDFDIVVAAYDAVTGDPIWDGEVRTFDGEASGKDEPVAIAYSDATRTLYVTGVSKRPFPHGQDVVTIAYDALTGEQRAVAYAAGTSSSAENVPTGLVVSPDGSRVFVSATTINTYGTGGPRVSLVAYDADLNPAGTRDLAGAGSPSDRAAGVALSLDGQRVILAGSTDRGGLTGLDLHAAAWRADGFRSEPVEPEPVQTSLAFTDETTTHAAPGDQATLAARLTDAAGAPLAGRTVHLSLGDDVQSATTDADGVARATFAVDLEPGTHPTSASFTGSGVHQSSSTSGTLTVERRVTSLTLTVSGNGPNRTLTATLTDADGPLAGRQIAFSSDGQHLGTAVTGADGVARLSGLPPAYRGGSRPFEATFAGDARHAPATASTTS